MYKKVQEDLLDKKLDAVLVSSHPNIVYLTGFSGFVPTEREAYLFITPKSLYIITDSRYSVAVKNEIPNFILIEISVDFSHFDAIKKLINQYKISSLGVEEDDLTIKEHKKIEGSQKISHYSPASLRAVKTKDEIKLIKRASQLGDKTFDYMLTIIKPGKTEKQLAWEMEKFVKDAGAELSFDPIIAFNEHAASPHHQNTSDKLLATSHQLILMDFGVKVDNYCSDMTRVVFWGKASSKQKKVYQTVLASQQKAVEYLALHLQGGRLEKADKVARDYIESQDLPPYGHGLGHGIGLEVHEPPRLSISSKDKLKNGMVFSIEPGVYLPGEFGVRIEDLFAVQGKKLMQLTHAPKNIIEL